ncbi:similar to Saccharomyces cerevisiae YBR012C Dubious open reading frame, unlikely to encode a functional protein [Maudiozyma saulgeensis]|uniref:Similar to Saccharomyces cerevisiae YBR012C Dubious open reading frame, unlikely to encode a functional protein n=1 Tax=Maudiozyma saulgeensis TaxID=1789683 RepID=A0A1X7RBE5_9SACH|nr:similar to Saccharomyces cerevisiae YBR012C Dubious open reading frame, unlikely to encode a functional protein [Kazachstania saulgeensis]
MKYYFIFTIILAICHALQDDNIKLGAHTDMFQTTNRTFELNTDGADMNLKLLQLVSSICGLISSIYHLFTDGEITRKITPVRTSTNIHNITLNGTQWEYAWSSQSMCVTYDSFAVDEAMQTILNFCIDEYSYNITLAMCIIIDLPDICSYEIRLQRKTDIALKIRKPFENIWNIRCNGYGNQHITYVGGLCYPSDSN